MARSGGSGRGSGRGGSGGSGRGGSSRGGQRRRGRAARPPTNRHYPRTARLNALLHQIVADHLERVDDDRLGFLTVTGVEVDSDLNKAEVFISALGVEPDPEADADYLEALGEYRKPIQAEIASQARLRKTPEVVFAFDPGVRAGVRIEEILSGLDLPSDEQDEGETLPPGESSPGGSWPSGEPSDPE